MSGLKILSEIDALQQRIGQSSLSPETAAHLRNYYRIGLTYASNAALLRHGFPVTAIPPVLRGEYIALLERAHEDDADFIAFIAERVRETQKEYLRLIGGRRGRPVHAGVNTGPPA